MLSNVRVRVEFTSTTIHISSWIVLGKKQRPLFIHLRLCKCFCFLDNELFSHASQPSSHGCLRIFVAIAQRCRFGQKEKLLSACVH